MDKPLIEVSLYTTTILSIAFLITILTFPLSIPYLSIHPSLYPSAMYVPKTDTRMQSSFVRIAPRNIALHVLVTILRTTYLPLTYYMT